MRIGILQTGRAHETLRPKHGDFDSMFGQLLSDGDFEMHSYPVLDGVFPESAQEQDGWLVTGSRSSVYEDLPWISRLEEFLRVAQAADVPVVGICFGHQALAQALGGVVAKYRDGWGVGPQHYELAGHDNGAVINAWHQDQVVRRPEGTEVVGRSGFCENAALLYGRWAFSLQPHPEFSDSFVADLLELRKEALDPGLVEVVRATMTRQGQNHKVSRQIVQFFRERRIT